MASVPPIRVDNTTARSDTDAYEGGPLKVVGGTYTGALGVFTSVVDYDQSDGYPTSILVTFSDPSYSEAVAVLNYADVVPAGYIDPSSAAAQKRADEAEARVILA